MTIINNRQQSSIYLKNKIIHFSPIWKQTFLPHNLQSSISIHHTIVKIHKIFIFYQKSHTIHQHILITVFSPVLSHFYSILYRKTYLKKFFMLKNTHFHHIYTNVFKIIPFFYICWRSSTPNDNIIKHILSII